MELFIFQTSSSINLSNKEYDDSKTQVITLIEQRDSRMNDYGYSIEDPTVSKLNQEIRARLIQSNKVT